MFTPNGNSNFSVNTAPPTNQGSLPLVVIDENEGSAIANDVRPSGPDAETIIDYSKKLQDDLQALAKIKLHEENIKAWRTEKDELDDSILEKQVTLGKYYSSTPASTRNDSSSYTGGEEQILRHGESAAEILCQLKKHPSSISPLASNKDILGVVATLGRVDDVNLSRLLSEYVGVETMLAIVCKAGAGVKALEDYSKEGAIDKNAGIHGCSAYMGRALTGRFLVLCLENLRPYVGGFVSEDPQRRLQIPMPRLPNGECPPGFLGFAVNMIDMDATHLFCQTPCGYGLRETLFYHLFSRTQVYRTRAEMLSARPLISEGAISFDGGIIRSFGVDLLGNRQEVDVHFPSASAAPESSVNYQELQEKVTNLKSRREKVLEDLQKERQLLDHVKLNFEQKKQEFVKFMACSSAYTAQMHPGPLDASVLSRQDRHRSQLVWDSKNDSNSCLTCRRAEASFRRREADQPLDPRMTQLLSSAGFLGVSKLPFIQLDWHLITALVERWRPETHSFHMPVGEVTITLQDIAIQFGLSIDGPPVIGHTSHIWRDLCEQYLGRAPPTACINGGRLKMSWLGENFSEMEEEDDIVHHTRAYILQLMGGLLFADKSQNKVHLMFLPLLKDLQPEEPYSWGSAVLAWLYRQLCRASDKDVNEISGALLLVQLWAWDRMPYIAPIRRQSTLIEDAPLGARWGVKKNVTETSTHVVMQYRIFFDRQTPSQFVWQPYTEEIMMELPHYCTRDAAIWTAKVPLICFHIIEWHLPDRVVRQLGGTQGIPQDCDTEVDLHKIDLRNKTDAGWRSRHNKYIRIWQSRHDRVVQVITGARDVQSNYMSWYLLRTRRWISKTGATFSYLIKQLQNIRDYARTNDYPSVEYIEKLADNALRNARVHDIVHPEDEEYVHDHGSGLMEIPTPVFFNEQNTPQSPTEKTFT